MEILHPVKQGTVYAPEVGTFIVYNSIFTFSQAFGLYEVIQYLFIFHLTESYDLWQLFFINGTDDSRKIIQFFLVFLHIPGFL